MLLKTQSSLLQHFHIHSEQKACIPLIALWSLPNADIIMEEVILQLICIIHFICQCNDLFLYHLPVHHIYIVYKKDEHGYHCLMDEKIQLGYLNKSGYQVRFDWDHIQFHKNTKGENFSFEKNEFHQSIFWQIMSDYRLHVLDYIPKSHIFHNLYQCCQKFSPIIHLPVFDNDLTGILWQIIPLPISHDGNQNNSKEIKFLFQQIQDQYDKLIKQFKNATNAKILFTKWQMILKVHYDEFWELVKQSKQLDGFIKRIRNYLYQSLVDHDYQHIQLKDINFKKLIISSYLWANEYIAGLPINLFKKDGDNFDSMFMMIMDIFHVQDSLDFQDKIHIHSFKKSYHQICTTNDVIQTHPCLRPKWIYDTKFL